MNIKRYTNKFYAAVKVAQAEANRTGLNQNVVETVYGVFTGPTSEYPANLIGCYSTIIRPVKS